MKEYLAIIAMDIKLALRLRAVIFFNYLFPLIFFFTFATFLNRGSDKGPMIFVVTMSITLGVLGSGFLPSALEISCTSIICNGGIRKSSAQKSIVGRAERK